MDPVVIVGILVICFIVIVSIILGLYFGKVFCPSFGYKCPSGSPKPSPSRSPGSTGGTPTQPPASTTPQTPSIPNSPPPVCGISWILGTCRPVSGSCGAGNRTDGGFPLDPVAGTSCTPPPASSLIRSEPCDIPCNNDCHINWQGSFTTCIPSCGGSGTQSEVGLVDVAKTGSGQTCKQVYPNLEGSDDSPSYYTSVKRTVSCTTPACPTTTKTWNTSGSGVGATASSSAYITTPADATLFQTFNLTATIQGSGLSSVSLAAGKSKVPFNTQNGNVYTWNVAPSFINAPSKTFYIYASPSISSVSWTINSTYV
jgi:hypothetical protein